MPLNGEAERPVSTWTKDYVEHLRTVHFSLLTATFGLIVFAFSYHPEKIHLAFSEADQIVELTNADYSLTSLAKKEEPQRKMIRLPMRGATPLEFETPRNSYFDLDHVSGAYPETKPKTLADFESIWEKAEVPRHVLIIEKDAVCQIFDPGANQWVNEDLLERVGNSGSRTRPGETTPRLSWSASPDGSDTFLLLANVRLASAQTGGTEMQVRLRCRGATDVVNIQKRLAGILGVQEGPFETAFPELSEMVDRRDRSRPLERIKEQLLAETTAKATDFEAFGLHIPSGVVVPCGLFVILAIQWYFFLHVSEIERQFPADAPGWDVPWIGIYGKGLAKGTFILSTTLLPTVGVIMLLVRGVQVGSKSYIWLLLPLSAFSLTVGILIVVSTPKKSRPKRESGNVNEAGSVRAQELPIADEIGREGSLSRRSLDPT